MTDGMIGLLMGVAFTLGLVAGGMIRDSQWTQITGATSRDEFKACAEQLGIPTCKNKMVVFNR